MTMKRVAGLIVLLVVGLTVVPAAADFYVIAGSGNAGTRINSVPYTITSPGLYRLGRNLTYSSTTGNAITVAASNVTLDLMGFCLTGPGKLSGSENAGIIINNGCSNVEIRNGSIQAFGYSGIYTSGSCPGTRAIGLRVSDMGSGGMILAGNNHLIMGCEVMRNGFGISVGWAALIKGNQVFSNTSHGIGADKATVTGNIAYLNGDGISVSDSLVADNSAYNNTNRGISCGNNCTIARNTSLDNAAEGIYAGSFCTITNNTTKGLTYGGGCTLQNNTVVP